MFVLCNVLEAPTNWGAVLSNNIVQHTIRVQFNSCWMSLSTLWINRPWAWSYPETVCQQYKRVSAHSISCNIDTTELPESFQVTPRSTNQWDTNTGFVETKYWLIAWIRRVDGVYDIIWLYLMGVINTLKTGGPNLVSRWLLHGVSQDVTVLAQWTMDTLKHPKTLNNRSREVLKIASGTGSSNYNLYNIYMILYDYVRSTHTWWNLSFSIINYHRGNSPILWQ